MPRASGFGSEANCAASSHSPLFKTMAQSKRFSPMRYTAATEEAAVSGALELVGATRDEADYEVLSVNDKGVTVRVKPREVTTEATSVAPVAQVAPPVTETPAPVAELDEASELEEDEPEIDEEVDEEEADSEIEAQLVVEDEDIPSLEEENEAIEEDEDAEASFEDESYEGEEADEDEEDEDAESDEASTLEAEPEVEPEPEPSVSDEVIASAKAKAQEFLEKMGMDATCLYEQGATSTTVPLIIEGNDVGILIGKHGSTLQAFQYLLNLTVNNGNEPESGVRVVVDAGNYRARRQNSLEQTARAAAQRARMSGRPVRLDAMPASERRIIHMFLQNEPGITTQSEGREPQRRLVIFPAGSGGTGRYEERSSGGGRGMGGFNRGRGGRGFRR